jgi:RNA polymerase sigma-70 factor (ECF subfamily)
VTDFIRKRTRDANRLKKAGKDETLTYLKAIRLPEINAIAEREWEIHLTNLALENIESLFSGKAVAAFRLTLKGRSVEEIAKELDLKENSVYRLKNRVKDRLIQEIMHLREELE